MRKAVVFGGASGIGKHIAENLKGFDIISIFDRKLDNDQNILNEIAVMEAVKDADFVVNCVGVMSIALIEDLTVDEFVNACKINLVGSFIVVKACKINKVKNLILFSSNSGLSGFSNMAAYCASKFGIIGLMQVAAKEMATYGGVCNAICPSALKYGETDMTLFQGEKFMKTMNIKTSEELDKALSSRIPMKRLCTREDITEWMNFLANIKSNFFTGQVISLTGGMNMVK